MVWEKERERSWEKEREREREVCCYNMVTNFLHQCHFLQLETELDIPMTKPSSTSTSHYHALAPSMVIQDTSLNLSLLTQNNGTTCVCYQHSIDKTAENVSFVFFLSMLLCHFKCTFSTLYDLRCNDYFGLLI